jgi:hypothetical protein
MFLVPAGHCPLGSASHPRGRRRRGEGGQEGDSVHFTKVDVYVGARPETPSTDQEGPVIVDG